MLDYDSIDQMLAITNGLVSLRKPFQIIKRCENH